MPIIWRYLLGQYLKVLGICVVAFITVLLSTRLDEVASFATTGAASKLILSFLFYQIPYILPIALPISCVISSILLFQQLSQTHQITALRACGLAMRQITSPILLAATALALLNFYIVSEMATQSHLATRQLENEIRSLSPMLLLQNKKLLRSKGFYANELGPSKPGELATDVVLAMHNRSNQRLNVLLAKRINANDDEIRSDQATVFVASPPKDHNGFDHLIIEDLQSTVTPLADLRQALVRQGWRLNPDHLRFSLLMVRTKDLIRQLHDAKAAGLPKPQAVQNYLNRCFTEISRRISLAGSVFAFTLMGASFGMSISRFPSKRKLAIAIGLTAFYLVCFFTAKEIDTYVISSTLLYLMPLVVIILLSTANLRRLTRGVE